MADGLVPGWPNARPGRAGTTRRAVVLGAAAAVGVLAACQQGTGTSQLGAKQLRSGITVTWRTHIQTVALSDEVGQLWAPKHPNIKINYEHMPVAPALDKLIAEMAADTPPEVALVLYTSVPKLQPQVTNMAPYVRRDKFSEKDFFPAALDQYRFKGESFAMPYDFPVRVVWYNASLFQAGGAKLPPGTWDAPGWTWDDFAETARRLARVDSSRPDESTWGVRWGVDMPGVLECLYFIYNNAGGFLSKDGTTCTVHEPAALEGMQFVHDLINRWHVARTRADVQGSPGDRFLQGKMAMDIFRPVAIAQYRRELKFEWALAPLPLGPRGKQRATLMGGSAWVWPAGNKNKEEAWELMQHLISPEVEKAQIKHVGIMPARRAVLDEYAAEEPPKNMKLVLRAAESAILIPQTPWYPEANDAAQVLLNELWDGKRSVAVTGQEIKRQVDELLKRPFTFQ